MEKPILDFPKQLKFKPVIENKAGLKKAKKFLVTGMGGSNLATGLIKTWNPAFDVTVWRDYNLPELPDNLKNYLTIVSSYSGNTEEAISGFYVALKKKLPMACIAIGGELIELAKKHHVPYIQIPNTGIEPRSGMGFSMVSMLKIMGQEKALKEVASAADAINMNELRQKGEAMAARLKNSIPVIYSSNGNESIARNWKIKLNETGKIPAFYNVFPELCHNEIVGFDGNDATKALRNLFYFIFLKDHTDHERIQLRMDIMKDILTAKGLRVEILELEGKTVWEKIFFSTLTADWTAYTTATKYGADPWATDIVKKLKDMIKPFGKKI